jgi:hypothetical protein
MSNFVIKSAIYGDFNPSHPQAGAHAVDVSAALANALQHGSDGKVNINNNTMGGDPAYGIGKHFDAVFSNGTHEVHYAGREGETIEFKPMISPGDLLPGGAGKLFSL